MSVAESLSFPSATQTLKTMDRMGSNWVILHFGEFLASNVDLVRKGSPSLDDNEVGKLALENALENDRVKQAGGIGLISAAYEQGRHGTTDYPFPARRILDKYLQEQRQLAANKK